MDLLILFRGGNHLKIFHSLLELIKKNLHWKFERGIRRPHRPREEQGEAREDRQQEVWDVLHQGKSSRVLWYHNLASRLPFALASLLQLPQWMMTTRYVMLPPRIRFKK